jgi:D-alanyl-D-alanine carboxypeptidase
MHSMRRLFRQLGAISLGLVLGVVPILGSMSAPSALAQDSTTSESSLCTTRRDHAGVVAVKTTLAPAPAVGAKAAAVINRSTGQVLYELRGRERLALASTTKIMTAIIALESGIDESQTVLATTNAADMSGSSVMGLWTTARVSYRDLLYGLMLPSGNDAALDLARHLGPTEAEFMDRMNAKAEELGLEDTHFANPHGLDERGHYSSARDLALLGSYAMGNARFRELAATVNYHLPAPFDYSLYNGNSFLSTYPGANGIKIGWTESAGWTFVASAERDGEEVVVALLDTPDRDADATALMDWAFDAPEWQAVDASVVRTLQALSRLPGVNLVERFSAGCPADLLGPKRAKER